MFHFLHAADIHLDSPLRGLESYEDAPVDEIRGATRRAFDNLIDLAIAEKVHCLLLAGDLFDGDWKDYNTGLFFISRLARLRKEKIQVFIVSGNHDAESQIARTLHLPDNVHLFSARHPETKIVEHSTIAIHGQSYSARAVTKNLAASYPVAKSGYFNIGMLHTALTGREGHEPYAPCLENDLQGKNYDYWALGHIHTREIVSKEPWIVFPGNIQGRHVRETGAKGASLITVENSMVTDVSHQNLDILRWVSCCINLSGTSSDTSPLEQVRHTLEHEQDNADGRPLAIRLELTGNTVLNPDLFSNTAILTEEIREMAVGLGSIWLEKVLYKSTKKNTPIAQDHDLPLDGLMEAVAQLDFSEETLLNQIPELRLLKNKLPPALSLLNNPLIQTTPEQQDNLRGQIRELLAANLIRQRGNS